MLIVDHSARNPHCASDTRALLVSLRSIQHDMGEDLAENAEKGYSVIVIAIASLVLRHTSFLPAL